MSLRFAILTALSERGSTGLELSRRFDKSIGYFWPASHQQIYRELDRLAGDGLVTRSDAGPSGQSGRGAPKAYAITPAGTGALRAWVDDVADPVPWRDPLFVRLRAAAALGEAATVRAAIRRHLDRHEEASATFVDIERRDFDPPADTRARMQHLVLEAGIEVEAAFVRWCRHALEVLDDIEAERSSDQT